MHSHVQVTESVNIVGNQAVIEKVTTSMVVSQFSLKTPRCYAGVIMHDLAVVVPVTQLLDNYFTIRASRVTANLFVLLPSRVVQRLIQMIYSYYVLALIISQFQELSRIF